MGWLDLSDFKRPQWQNRMLTLQYSFLGMLVYLEEGNGCSGHLQSIKTLVPSIRVKNEHWKISFSKCDSVLHQKYQVTRDTKMI